MNISDWRTGLEWIPLLVFLVLIFFWILIAALGGYKRTLYWGVGNLILYFLGCIFAVTLSDALAKSIINTFKISIEDFTQQELIDALKPFMGLIFYLICFLGGNLVLLLPLYFAVFKRVFKIGKYDVRTKAYAKRHNGDVKERKNLKWSIKKYSLVSRAIAVPSAFVLFYPMVATFTEIAIAGTTSYNQVQKNTNLKNIYNMTAWWNNVYPYCDDMLVNINALLSGLFLMSDSPTTGTAYIDNLVNNIQAPFDEISGLSDLDTITPEKITTILDTFKTVDDKATIEEYIDGITLSKDYGPIFDDVIDKFIEAQDALDKDTFNLIDPLVEGLKYGTTINAINTDNTIDSLPLTTNYEKLSLTERSYDFFLNIFKDLFFDKTTFTDDELTYDASCLLSLFIKISDENYTQSKDLSLGEVLDPDDVLAKINSFSSLFTTDAIAELEAANGSSDNPYIVPAQLLYDINSTQTTSNPDLNTKYLSANKYLYWSFYPILENPKIETTFSYSYKLNGDISHYLKANTIADSGGLGFTYIDSPATEGLTNGELIALTKTNPKTFNCTITVTDNTTKQSWNVTKYFQLEYLELKV